MTSDDHPWAPPVAGGEAEHLIGALERLRTTFRWKADDLDAAGLSTKTVASQLTIAGLLKHLALVEDAYFGARLGGESLEEHWSAEQLDDPEWEFTSDGIEEPDVIYGLWDDAVERSRARLSAALAAGGLGQPIHQSWPDGSHPNLRRLICDLIEEYGRHTGHADFIREAVDGRVGEDPPAGWRPRSGRFRLPNT